MSDNIVNLLREKTEEVDFDSILKTSMGRYTKKSVFEYLAQVKQQEQNMKEHYNQEIRQLLDAKEKLQVENEVLKNRTLKAETDYQSIFEQLSEKDNGEWSAGGMVKLKQEYALLSKNKDKWIEKIKDDEKVIERYKILIDQEKKETQKAQLDVKTNRVLLSDLRKQNEEQRKTISRQTCEITRLQNEVKYLRKIVSDGNVAELNAKIDELLTSAELLQNEILLRDREIESKEKRIASLTLQEKTNYENLEKLRESVKQTQENNEKLEGENENISKQLEEYMAKCIELYRLNSSLKVGSAILQRKLDAEKLKKQIEEIVPNYADVLV